MSGGTTLARRSNSELNALLEKQFLLSQRDNEISYERPDPILVARRYKEPYSAMTCALFGYGRADLIVRFLDTLDFALLDADESVIRNAFEGCYYRFQNAEDIIQFFITLRRFKQNENIESLFTEAYRHNASVIEGINALITSLMSYNDYQSRGYRFLVGAPSWKLKGAAPMKRWMMFLRWMIREDAIDFGLWKGVDTKDLLMPLDTHTFNVSRRLGLLRRKNYDLQSVVELTRKLRRFDPSDPVKYDFALYRLGQERVL